MLKPHPVILWRKPKVIYRNKRCDPGALLCAEDMAFTGLTAREFLRVPVFQMLHRDCDQGNARLLALMRDLVTGASRVTSH